MKTDLLDILIYVLKSYPRLKELSKPRLVKLIYLMDWKSSVESNSQLSDINWYYNHYGPYVDDIINLVKSRPDLFEVRSYTNYYGGTSEKISLKDPKIDSNLSQETKRVIDFIIEKTNHYNWNDFVSLVYSTYPTKNNARYSYLDLENEAIKFKEYRQQLQK